jgi:hypothetical protein
MDIKDQIQPVVTSLLENLKVSMEQEFRDKITQEIIEKVAAVELVDIINSIVREQIIEKQIETLTELKHFSPSSVHHSIINFKGLILSGNSIKGGIIENFGSTGIEDRATNVKLTLLDHASVFENTVFAPKLEVKGDLTIDGMVTLKGDIATDSPAFNTLVTHSMLKVKEELNEELFQGFSNTIHKNLLEQGLDLDRITQGGREVIKGPQLGYHITDSNLQRLGVVVDLQTKGENLLSDTLYVSGSRVGINTIDPSASLAVWDQEVEIVVIKRKQDTGYIGTSRHQRVILGSNNKENITLNTDGSVEIEEISIGNIPMTSAATTPNYEGRTGQIVWNESPNLGGSIGWVCLGGHRWSKFGKIE